MASHHFLIHLLAKSSAVAHNLVRMCTCVAKALPDAFLHSKQEITTEGALPEYPSQGDRQPGISLPPFTEVKHFFKIIEWIGEAALVNDQPSKRISLRNRVHDTVEGHDRYVLNGRIEEPQQQVRSGKLAGNRNGAFLQIAECCPGSGNDERAASSSERPSRAEQGIVFPQMAEGVVRYFGNVEPPIECHPVQGLDIFQLLAEFDAGNSDFAVRKGIEDKRIIRAGRVTYGEGFYHRSQPSRICSTAICAASAAAGMFHFLRSRSSTMLDIPRNSSQGTPCSSATCAAAAPSMFSQMPW